jgi:hypothetical protein
VNPKACKGKACAAYRIGLTGDLAQAWDAAHARRDEITRLQAAARRDKTITDALIVSMRAELVRLEKVCQEHERQRAREMRDHTQHEIGLEREIVELTRKAHPPRPRWLAWLYR